MSNGSALMLAGGLLKGFGTLRSSKQDAKALRRQSREAYAQGYQDEAVQRREARALMGAQAAAIAQAGIGYGGTIELVMKDSELAAEMDALNYRYRGTQQGSALREQAKRVKKDGRLLAGAQILGAASEYQYNRQILSNAER
jgi:hypothetical protein